MDEGVWMLRKVGGGHSVCLAKAFYHAIFGFDCGWNLRASLSLRDGPTA
jgi:hypothetical protein